MARANARKPMAVRYAESWEPEPNDPYGEDKRKLIRFLLRNNISSENPRPINTILTQIRFSEPFRRESFQHAILGPLRRDRRVFVGTKSNGIFIVTKPEDVDATLGFYTWRIRAELRHARNLRALARRTKLMTGFQSKFAAKKERAIIYIDESGNPDVRDRRPPVFVVAAVVIDSHRDLAGMDQRFKNAFAMIGRPEDHEMRTASLSVQKHTRVLDELSLMHYQWAAACFDKRKLRSAGFSNPTTFYRYAMQFLVGDVLSIAWEADVVIDQYSTPGFQALLEGYLRNHNSGLPVNRLNSVRFADSSKIRLVQLADLVAGAVRRHVEGHGAPLEAIDHQQLNLQFWPPS